jgi:Peptide arylation enzymes
MSIPFSRWPAHLAARYREKGYWIDVPLTDIIDRHRENDAIAVIDGPVQLSYRQLAQRSDNLAAALQRRGLQRGDTALVQLGNVADFTLRCLPCLSWAWSRCTRCSAISALNCWPMRSRLHRNC